MVHITFSKPEGATKVVMQRSTDKVIWTEVLILTPDSQFGLVPTVSGVTNYFKLVVTGGTHAGESSVLEVQAM